MRKKRCKIPHLRNHIVIGFQNKYWSGLFISSSLLLLRIKNKMYLRQIHQKTDCLFEQRHKKAVIKKVISSHTPTPANRQSKKDCTIEAWREIHCPCSSNCRHLLCYISHQQHNLPEALFPKRRHKCSLPNVQVSSLTLTVQEGLSSLLVSMGIIQDCVKMNSFFNFGNIINILFHILWNNTLLNMIYNMVRLKYLYSTTMYISPS